MFIDLLNALWLFFAVAMLLSNECLSSMRPFVWLIFEKVRNRTVQYLANLVQMIHAKAKGKFTVYISDSVRTNTCRLGKV